MVLHQICYTNTSATRLKFTSAGRSFAVVYFNGVPPFEYTYGSLTSISV